MNQCIAGFILYNYTYAYTSARHTHTHTLTYTYTHTYAYTVTRTQRPCLHFCCSFRSTELLVVLRLVQPRLCFLASEDVSRCEHNIFIYSSGGWGTEFSKIAH